MDSKLSDNQRRFFCRMVFLACCVVPTSIVAYLIFHAPGPDDWEQLILANLGVRVEIESVENPIHGRTILRGVRLIESVFDSSDSPTMIFPEVHLTQSGRSNEIAFVQPVELPGDLLADAINRCNDQLEQVDLNGQTWNVLFEKVTIDDSKPFVLGPAKLTIAQIPTPTSGDKRSFRARLLTWIPHLDHPTPIAIDYQKSSNREYLNIDTGQVTLPCRLLQRWQPKLASLGDSSLFSGQINLDIVSKQSVFGEIDGRLTNLHLDEFDETLVGVCSAEKLQCRISKNQIESLHMQIKSNRPGKIGRRLLADATYLGIVGAQNQIVDLPFDSFSMAVEIEKGRVTFSSIDSVIARDSAGQSILLCSGESAALDQLAMMITGEEFLGDRSIAFMNGFKVRGGTSRSAFRNEGAPSFQR